MSTQHRKIWDRKSGPAHAHVRASGYVRVVNKLSGKQCLCRLLKLADADSTFVNVCRMSAVMSECPYAVTAS